MRLLHTGDLHIGKTVNNFNMLEDQKHILTQMVNIAIEQKVQAFIIAGDVYDRAIPTAEAVRVFDDFIEKLHTAGIVILCISGNHDSPERLSFAQEILEKKDVYFAGVYKDACKQVCLYDEYGPVVFTLMPFVKPAVLQENTSDAAVRHMLQDTFCFLDNDEQTGEDVEETQNKQRQKAFGENGLNIDGIRQVLITHYFVTNAGIQPELSDSETNVLVGGLDNVDCSCFKGFHYTALGHIHKPQRMDKEKDGYGPIVYAGAPLAYSFSECGQDKSVVLVDMEKDGKAIIDRIPLKPLHEMKKLKGALEDLIASSVLEIASKDDYFQITLTNEEELIDPIGTLRRVYPNIMQLLFEKREKEIAGEFVVKEGLASKAPGELFADFYKQIRNQEMDEERSQVIQDILAEMI